MEWKNMSNSEIEVKLKELEFEYEKCRIDINKLYDKLEDINSNYLKGKQVIDKRLNPIKIL